MYVTNLRRKHTNTDSENFRDFFLQQPRLGRRSSSSSSGRLIFCYFFIFSLLFNHGRKPVGSDCGWVWMKGVESLYDHDSQLRTVRVNWWMRHHEHAATSRQLFYFQSNRYITCSYCQKFVCKWFFKSF